MTEPDRKVNLQVVKSPPFGDDIDPETISEIKEKLPVVEKTPMGYRANITESRYLRLQITQKCKQVLEDNGFFRRNGELFEWKASRVLDKIPDALYEESFTDLEVAISTELKKRKKGGGYSRHDSVTREVLPIGESKPLMACVNHKVVLASLLEDNPLRELRYINEDSKDDKAVFIPQPVHLNLNTKLREQASKLFGEWRGWMEKEAKDQWDFFARLSKEHLFSRKLGGHHRRFINVGVGNNGGGKGTFIKIMDSLPFLFRTHSWNPEEAKTEFTLGQIFDDSFTLSVCHEWRQIPSKEMPGFIAVAKSALRSNEWISVRTIAKKSKTFECRHGLVLFYNADASGRENALKETYRLFADWNAFDRFNIVHIDWALRYPDFDKFREVLVNMPLFEAFGMAWYDWAKSLESAEIEHYPIPAAFRALQNERSLSRFDKKLEDILESWESFEEALNETNETSEGVLISEYLTPEDPEKGLAAQKRLAGELMRPHFRRDIADSLSFYIRAGRLQMALSADAVNALARELGENRKWEVPDRLTAFLEKGWRPSDSHRRWVRFTPRALEPEGVDEPQKNG